MNAYTPYERSTLSDLEAASRGPFCTPISALVHAVGEEGRSAPTRRHPRQERLGSALRGALVHLNAVATSTLSRPSVYKTFRREGYRRVRTLDDVRRMELWEVDEVADGVERKYVAGGAVLGALAGALGLRWGVLIDLPVVTLLAFRAIGEYALHYGYDPSSPEERAFAIAILTGALSPKSDVHGASLDELIDAGTSMARTWKREKDLRLVVPVAWALGKRLFGTLIRRADRRLASRIGSRAFSVASAGANAWLVFGVMRTARAMYRERRLRRG